MDNREADRRAVLYHSPLADSTTEEVAGHLVNVSPKGIRFMSEKCFAKGQDVNLVLKMPCQVMGKTEVAFTGTVRWCRRDVNPEYYGVGLEIDALDEEIREALLFIHSQYCFCE